LEIPRAMLSTQVGGKEHARMAITASRRYFERVASRSATS